MKKGTMVAIMTLTIGLTLAIVGAVFQDITTWSDSFNPVNLAAVLQTIGYLAAALSGIVLVAGGVANAIMEQTKK